MGSLFTALASFLGARAQNGEWLLRIDDIDPERSRPEAVDAIQRTLDRHGLRWDRQPIFQSRNLDQYQRALDRLRDLDLLYPCRCTRRELAESGADAVYPGRCRGGSFGAAQANDHAVRLRAEGPDISFQDRLQGPVTQHLPSAVGDFIVRRRDLTYAYHLASVVDDAVLGITEVIRGIDLLDSTPRQIYLQRLLGFPTPMYLHLPVLIDSDGRKLSKQTLARPVGEAECSETLYRLLRLLRQDPPLELAGAPPEELLDWAIPHWTAGALAGLAYIPLPETRASQSV